MRKQKKIPKTIVIKPEVNEVLIALSEQTGYNHSEVIEIAIKNLSSNTKYADILEFNEIIQNTINLLSSQLLSKDVG